MSDDQDASLKLLIGEGFEEKKVRLIDDPYAAFRAPKNGHREDSQDISEELKALERVAISEIIGDIQRDIDYAVSCFQNAFGAIMQQLETVRLKAQQEEKDVMSPVIRKKLLALLQGLDLEE